MTSDPRQHFFQYKENETVHTLSAVIDDKRRFYYERDLKESDEVC